MRKLSLKISFVVIVMLFLAIPAVGFAAQEKPKNNAAQQPQQAQTQKETPQKETPQKDEKETETGMKKPEPKKKAVDPDARELSGRDFMTKDRVLLSGSFYPGNADKDTVPVLLFHGQGKSREEFAPLIAEMKKKGFAILAIDFRGHGESTKKYPDPKQTQQPQQMQQPAAGMVMPQRKKDRMPPGMGGGVPGRNERQQQQSMMPMMVPQQMPQQPTQPMQPVEYLVENFAKVDYENMYKYDYVQFYRYLVHENNQERLNLNKLVIVGAGMGGSVGGKLARELAKAKNVRSLIVVSPNYDPFSKKYFKDAKCFQEDTPLLFVVGQLDPKAKENATKLRDDLLGKEKKKDDKPNSMESTAPIAEFPSERQGGDLLKESKLGIPTRIVGYIDETLAKHKEKELKWKKF